MEHTIVIREDDLRREVVRGEFLLEAIRFYAPHIMHDIEAELSERYPRAAHYQYVLEQDEQGQ